MLFCHGKRLTFKALEEDGKEGIGIVGVVATQVTQHKPAGDALTQRGVHEFERWRVQERVEEREREGGGGCGQESEQCGYLCPSEESVRQEDGDGAASSEVISFGEYTGEGGRNKVERSLSVLKN